MTRYLVLSILICVALFSVSANAAQLAPVHVLFINDQIDPAVANYVEDGIRDAESDGAQAVLIVMDTPGGLVDSTKDIIKSFFASRVPVIVYVAPDGAWAASAGALITMAGDIAAMAPATNIGSASPVQVGSGGEAKEMDETMKKKAFNALSQYARSIAQRRHRNVGWAEDAVRKAANLTATDALKQKVIDYTAADTKDLMRKLDGRKVELVSTHKTVTLHTKGAPLDNHPMGIWDGFLHVLGNPFVAMILTLGAIYCLIYELSNPGSIFPGVIAAISIILLLYSYSVIPINAAGFAFLALAVALFMIDLFAPTHGILTVGGVASMFFGLMMLFRATQGFMISIWVLAAVAVMTGAFFLFVIGLGVRSLRNPYVSGREGVVGHTGEARTDLDPTGKIFIDGALWDAISEEGTIQKGEKVVVTEMTGLKLTVIRANPNVEA